MKNFFKKIAVFIMIVAAVATTASFTTSNPVSARSLGDCNTTFLGMKAWDCGIGSMSSEADLTNNIVRIVNGL